MELDIELLRKICDNGIIHWSVHASEQIQKRGIFRDDVINAINTGKIIEQYPDAYPFPACLVFGLNVGGEYIHVVAGFDGSAIYIITAYYPTPDKFEDDLITRKEPKE